jgi:prepilin-type N-terminal cleavage/methylation domain-containing protein
MNRARRNGFTLVEVMIALVILAVAVLGIQGVAGNMLGLVGSSERKATAMRLAEDKIGEIRLEQNYANIDAFQGTENPVTGWPGFKRVTTVDHHVYVAPPPNRTTDWKRVSVTVTAPGITRPVLRIITRGAP